MPSRRVAGHCAAASVFLLASVTSAMAEPTGATPVASPVSARPASFWQANGVVWAMEYASGVVYAGGSFTSVRPPGSDPGTNEYSQAALAAFDSETGAFRSSWRPVVAGGQVQAIEVSPDGSRLYIGGDFTHVNGESRTRLAAFDISNPVAPILLPVAAFNAEVDRKVYDIEASASSVYVAGAFTSANDKARTLVASFTAAGGVLEPFEVSLTDAPTDINSPWATSISVGNGRAYIGGQFLTVDGVAQSGLAVVDAVTGDRDGDFQIPTRPDNGGWVTDTLYHPRTNTLFLVGRVPPAGPLRKLEGIEALDGTTGVVRWGGDGHRCLGDAFSLVVLKGIVWMATHAHNCEQIGTFPEQDPAFSWHAALLGQDVDTGEQVAFYPQVSGRPSVPGSLNNTRAIATDGSNLFVGGGFLSIDGYGNQQNLVKFPAKAGGGGIAPARPAPPVVTTRDGSAKVTWRGVFDRDDRNLTYEVLRRSNPEPIRVITRDSPWWAEPTMRFTDARVSPGQKVVYRIRVSDASQFATSVKSAPLRVR